MDTLDGHPLLMRAVLPRLEGGRSAKSILQELQGNLAADGTERRPDPEEGLRHAAIRRGRLARRTCVPCSCPWRLHDRFVDADYLEVMAKQRGSNAGHAHADRPLSVRPGDSGTGSRPRASDLRAPSGPHRLPACNGADTGRQAELESWQRAFVDVMGSLADALAPKELHEQRPYFHIHMPTSTRPCPWPSLLPWTRLRRADAVTWRLMPRTRWTSTAPSGCSKGSRTTTRHTGGKRRRSGRLPPIGHDRRRSGGTSRPPRSGISRASKSKRSTATSTARPVPTTNWA